MEKETNSEEVRFQDPLGILKVEPESTVEKPHIEIKKREQEEKKQDQEEEGKEQDQEEESQVPSKKPEEELTESDERKAKESNFFLRKSFWYPVAFFVLAMAIFFFLIRKLLN